MRSVIINVLLEEFKLQYRYLNAVWQNNVMNPKKISLLVLMKFLACGPWSVWIHCYCIFLWFDEKRWQIGLFAPEFTITSVTNVNFIELLLKKKKKWLQYVIRFYAYWIVLMKYVLYPYYTHTAIKQSKFNQIL